MHTLNGWASPSAERRWRFLEDYQQCDGSVVIPDVLRPYMQVQEIIEPAAPHAGH